MKTCNSCDTTAPMVIRYPLGDDKTANLCDPCAKKYNYTFN